MSRLARARAGLGRLSRRAAARARGWWYRARGRTPWTIGYHDQKMALVRDSLTHPPLLEAFRLGSALPRGYGARLDERVVEYPWALSRLGEGPARLLDAGSTLNHEEILDLPLLREKTIHIVTLAPEPECFSWKGVSYLYADLRALPVRDDYYDEAVCLSTLEHVGRDSSLYTGRASSADGDFLPAVRELRRVLKPGGVLLVTVPFGRRTELGFQLQFDLALVEQVREAFQPATSRLDVFRYSASGWEVSDAAAAADAEYFDVRTAPRFDADVAAAARAVACLELRK
jgi:SAM-dependent methyltransferase